MSIESYAPPVNQLLTYGNCAEMDFDNWPDYLELGIAPKDIPDLIRMATDNELYRDDEDTLESWAPIHAWRALGQLRAEAAIEPLMGLFEKRESNYWEWIAEELPLVYSTIGPAAIPALAAYLADTSQAIFPRTTAVNCLEEIAIDYPEARDECVTILTRQLKSFAENGPEFNSFLMASLVDLKAVESAPLMERVFAADTVDRFLVGDWDDVQVELGLKSPEELPKKEFNRSFPGKGVSDPGFTGSSISQETKGFRSGKSESKQKSKKKMSKESRKKNHKKRK
ncbi:HEAT repeat domain-containing protein [Coleofasciculus sp. H7-2]|uniref:HEAT repeat domain-containing protein n=1 Tax=Coleofasciculus sp. H7-2 TaxID=3351545 RepID=UPI003672E951